MAALLGCLRLTAPSISASLRHTGCSPSEPPLLTASLLIAESTGRGSPESPPLDQQVAQGVVVAPDSPEAEASPRSSGPPPPPGPLEPWQGGRDSPTAAPGNREQVGSPSLGAGPGDNGVESGLGV